MERRIKIVGECRDSVGRKRDIGETGILITGRYPLAGAQKRAVLFDRETSYVLIPKDAIEEEK